MQDVAIFWDYENCAAPSSASGYGVAENIRLLARPYGSVKSLKAYVATTAQLGVALRSELQASGVSLIDCVHNGRKEVADKMIIVDMLAYALDHAAPATIILITGDRDFAYALSILRLRQYHVVLVTLPSAHWSLTAQASECIDWHGGVLSRVERPAATSWALEFPRVAERKVVAAAKKAGAAKNGAGKKVGKKVRKRAAARRAAKAKAKAAASKSKPGAQAALKAGQAATRKGAGKAPATVEKPVLFKAEGGGWGEGQACVQVQGV